MTESFPFHRLGPSSDVMVLVPDPGTALKDPWIMLHTGETTVHIKLDEGAIDALSALAQDLKDARTLIQFRASLG